MPVNFDTLNQQMAAMMQGLQASPYVLDPSRLTGDPAANASLLYPTGPANKKPFVPASPMGMPGQGAMGAQPASPFAMPQPQTAFPAAASALASPQASPMAYAPSAATGGAPAAPGGVSADASKDGQGGGIPPGLLAMLAVGRSQDAAQQLQRGLVPQGMTGRDITSLIDQTRQMGMLGAFGLKPDFQFDVRQLAGGEDTPQSQWMRDILTPPPPPSAMSQGR